MIIYPLQNNMFSPLIPFSEESSPLLVNREDLNLMKSH